VQPGETQGSRGLPPLATTLRKRSQVRENSIASQVQIAAPMLYAVKVSSSHALDFVPFDAGSACMLGHGINTCRSCALAALILYPFSNALQFGMLLGSVVCRVSSCMQTGRCVQSRRKAKKDMHSKKAVNSQEHT